MSVVESLRCYIFNYLETTTLIDHVKYKTQNVSFHYKRRHSIQFSEKCLANLSGLIQTSGELKSFKNILKTMFKVYHPKKWGSND